MPKDKPQPLKKLTPKQIAEETGISHFTVLSWIRAGKLKAMYVGLGRIRPRYLVDRQDLEEFLEGQAVPVPQQAVREDAQPRPSYEVTKFF